MKVIAGGAGITRVIVAATLLVLIGVAGQFPTSMDAQESQGRPLPGRDAFLRAVRQKLRADEVLPSHYTFTQDETQTNFDGQGQVRKRTRHVYEIYPSVEDCPSYRRLVSADGVPIPAAQLQKADDKHRKEVLDWAHNREHETAADRARREQKVARARQEEERALDDIFRVLDIQLIARKTIRGRPAIEATFTPRPGAKTTVKDVALVTKIKGRAWIDEQDHEIVRIEGETIDTIGFGLGLLARVNKGTAFAFEQQKVADEEWLPLRATVRATGRIALLKRLDTEVMMDFRDYRKFTVETAVSFTVPKDAKDQK
jgi:hypothetical protein